MSARHAIVLALAASTLILAGNAAQAFHKEPYSQEAFSAAQSEGKPVLVEITASWCPTCRAQRPILAQLTAAPKFADLQIFEVDFDSQKDVVRAFKARMQSTLVAFRKAQEVGRSVGDTNKASIAALLDKTIKGQNP